MGKEVVLLDFWVSFYGMRARIALSEKGIDYDHQEHDPHNKSDLLLEMNPVHKCVPVLVHKGRPVCESLLILEYIDEVWPDTAPLLPSDPYQRAHARFWANYIDKVADAGRRICVMNGEEQEKAKAEFIEGMKVLEEKALGDKPFFGGDEFGFIDVTMVPFHSWYYAFEVEGDFKVEDLCPKLIAWFKRCLERECVAKSLPDPKRVHAYVVELRKRLGV